MEELATVAALNDRLSQAGVRLACPLCKGELTVGGAGFRCPACARSYPVIEGISDFRILPDRFIGLEEDRRKGRRVLELAAGRGFEAALEAYWSITPELDKGLARRHHQHQKEETLIGARILGEAEDLARASDRPLDNPATLLDVGCGTAGLLAAVSPRFSLAVGVDVAFRWLLVGRLRLQEAGANATLICANAEYLPFAAAGFDLLVANDLLEHVSDAGAAAADCRRVTRPGGRGYFATNNRYSLAPEPHVRLWGVGLVPRKLQSRYVRMLRGHSYENVRLISRAELRRLLESGGYSCRGGPGPAPVFESHLEGAAKKMARIHNQVRQWPLFRAVLARIAPRLHILCERGRQANT